MTMDPPLLLTSSSPAICCLIPTLPDDLAILCIARVPRSHHRFLASVSRAWRAFLRSPLFFSVRLELGASEHFLFINLLTPTSKYHWFLLDRPRPDYSPSLIPLPAQPYVSTYDHAVVAIDHSLCLLGGTIDGKVANIVQIYDARFNCWSLGPPMLVSRQHAAAGVISGRIYVAGGCLSINDCWAEEFDPKKKRWRRISSPPEVRQNSICRYAVIEGKLLLIGFSKFVIFDPAVVESEAWNLASRSQKYGIIPSVAALGEVLHVLV